MTKKKAPWGDASIWVWRIYEDCPQISQKNLRSFFPANFRSWLYRASKITPIFTPKIAGIPPTPRFWSCSEHSSNLQNSGNTGRTVLGHCRKLCSLRSLLRNLQILRTLFQVVYVAAIIITLPQKESGKRSLAKK